MTKQTLEQKLNSIRAGVLGANDGILTTTGVLFSMSVATTNKFLILIAGLSNLIACALSMSAGEYSSVSSQRDLEKAVVDKQNVQLRLNRKQAIKQIALYYVSKGMSEKTAYITANALDDPLKELVEIKYNIEIGCSISPMSALVYSLIFAFSAGVIPLICLLLSPISLQYEITLVGAIFSSGLITVISTKLGHGSVKKALIRNTLLVVMCIFANYVFGFLL